LWIGIPGIENSYRFKRGAVRGARQRGTGDRPAALFPPAGGKSPLVPAIRRNRGSDVTETKGRNHGRNPSANDVPQREQDERNRRRQDAKIVSRSSSRRVIIIVYSKLGSSGQFGTTLIDLRPDNFLD
jgi:hypothetical protein